MFFEVDCDIRKNVSGRFLELTGILDLVTYINKHSINVLYFPAASGRHPHHLTNHILWFDHMSSRSAPFLFSFWQVEI